MVVEINTKINKKVITNGTNECKYLLMNFAEGVLDAIIKNKTAEKEAVRNIN